MTITFGKVKFECRQVHTYPSRLRIGDMIVGPKGILLRVITVQPGCPCWESNRKTFTAVLLETEDHTVIPIRPENKVTALRPRKVS